MGLPDEKGEPNLIRIGDQDRSKTVEQLTKAYGEGRLNLEEFEERVAKTGQAKFQNDLNDLVVDLPGNSPIAEQDSDLSPALGGYFIAPIICTIIYFMTGPGGYFWPMWVWFGCMIPVCISMLFD